MLLSKVLNNIVKIDKDVQVFIRSHNGSLEVVGYTPLQKVKYVFTLLPTTLPDSLLVLSKDTASRLATLLIEGREGDTQSSQEDELKTLSIKDNTLIVQRSTKRTVVNAIKPTTALTNEFLKSHSDTATAIAKAPVFNLSLQSLENVIKYTSHASNDTSIGDIVLQGFHVLVKTGSRELELMASNGIIMALSSIDIEPVANVPTTGDKLLLVNRLLKSLPGLCFGETVQFFYTDEYVAFLSSDPTQGVTGTITYSLTKGKGVDYRNIVDKVVDSSKDSATLRKSVLLSAVNNALLFSDEDNHHKTTFHISNNGGVGSITVGAKSTYGEHSETVFDVNVTAPTTFTLNCSIFKKCLMAIPSSDCAVVIRYITTNPVSPILVETPYLVELIAPTKG